MLKKLTQKNKNIFLIDGLGAILTASLLGLVLSVFNEYFGMPQNILFILSIIALVFAVYSFSCFTFSANHFKPFLRPIIIANLTYCILTFGLVIYYFNRLTLLGISYFVGEILIICGLVFIELKTLTE